MVRAAVTAVVVNYNTGEHLHALVNLLAADPEVAKIVVVDNCSTDSSLNFLVVRPNLRLRLIRNDRNRGFGAACNQGAAQAETPYLLFINPDCVFPSGVLARLTVLLDARPEVAMLGPLILNGDGSEQRGCRRYLPNPRRALMRVLRLDHPDSQCRVSGFDLAGTPLPSVPTEVEAISGACMLVRRDALIKAGLWDEGYFLHCEDLDLCMRFKQVGRKILFVPDVAVIHHKGQSSQRRPVFVLWHKHRGMWRFYNKFYRASYPMPFNTLVLCGIWARFSILAIPAGFSALFRRHP